MESDPELWGTPTTHHQLTGFTCTSVQEHGCDCVHAYDPIHWHIDEGENKEPCLTKDGHVLQEVDAHSHLHKFADDHKHYAPTCHWSNSTQDHDAHSILWVGQRCQINVRRCKGGKGLLLEGCHQGVRRHHNRIPSLAWVLHHRSPRGCRWFRLPTIVQVSTMSCMGYSSPFFLACVHV